MIYQITFLASITFLTSVCDLKITKLTRPVFFNGSTRYSNNNNRQFNHLRESVNNNRTQNKRSNNNNNSRINRNETTTAPSSNKLAAFLKKVLKILVVATKQPTILSNINDYRKMNIV